MYEFVDYMKCKHCGNTNCLFKLRIDSYHKIKTGNIIYKTTSTCKLCYLENCLIKNERSYFKNKELILNGQKLYRIINKEKYNKRARGYYQKRREEALEQKRNKYVPIKKIGLLADVKYRKSLILFRR